MKLVQSAIGLLTTGCEDEGQHCHGDHYDQLRFLRLHRDCICTHVERVLRTTADEKNKKVCYWRNEGVVS